MNVLFKSAKKNPKMMRMIIDEASTRNMININKEDEFNFRLKHNPRRYESYQGGSYDASHYEMPT